MRMIGLIVGALALAALCAVAASAEGAAPDGKALYANNCAKCHGEDGSGATKMGKKLHAPDFRKERWQRRHDDEENETAVRDGVKEEGKVRMPAFSKKLTPEQIRAVAAFVRTFRPAEGAEPAPESKPKEEAQEPKAEPQEH
jgi:mono/diheme cytochrome c family protein